MSETICYFLRSKSLSTVYTQLSPREWQKNATVWAHLLFLKCNDTLLRWRSSEQRSGIISIARRISFRRILAVSTASIASRDQDPRCLRGRTGLMRTLRAYKWLVFPRWSSLQGFPFRYRLALAGVSCVGMYVSSYLADQHVQGVPVEHIGPRFREMN